MDKFVVIDIETTGHSVLAQDKMIEVGIVVIENSKISDQYTTLLNPHKTIPPFIENLTGIFDEDVIDAPSFYQKAEEIVHLFDNSYLVAHNVSFDLGFLNEELLQNGIKKLDNLVLDTVELARIFFPQAPSYKLSQLANYLKIEHDDPHRALADAYVTAEVFLKIKEKIDSLPLETIKQLIKLESRLESNLIELLNDRLELLNSSYIKPEGISVDFGLAYKEFKTEKRRDESVAMSYGEYLDTIYETNGSLENELERYEKRNGQREMSEEIFDAFRTGKHALIEAQTGTGKSLAYLLPAIYEAAKNDEPLIISTYTTQLQSQLLEEEIPLVKRIVPFPFSVALLKGKNHYISLERFAYELSLDQKDNYDITLTKAMILVWLTETKTGDIDEIQFPSSGYQFYKNISTESETLIDPSSPLYENSFYQKARSQALVADIIITNHALLCTDIFKDMNLLPSFQKVIIDEAHQFESVASRHFSLKLDYVTLQYTLNKIGMENDRSWFSNMLRSYPRLREYFNSNDWNRTLLQTKQEIDDLFRLLFQFVLEHKKNNQSLSDTGKVQYQFNIEDQKKSKWIMIKDMAARVNLQINSIIIILSDFLGRLIDSNDKFIVNDITENVEILNSFINRINQFFLHKNDKNDVKWMEIDKYGAKNAVFLYSERADVSIQLMDHFFKLKKNVILTSAALTMKDSFSFIQNRLGLKNSEVTTSRIASPFSYEEQVKLLIPNDFPDIVDENLDDFIFSTCEAILSLAEITDGRMLVLFTSYDMLRKSHAILKETLDLDTFVLISQGISSGSRERLKKNFQSFDQSILLGTSSFWEGVDIPGDDLSCVVIVRLPFQPPNNPLYEAKSNQLKLKGQNPFMELSLPQAVIRFKQGFGRLIRSTQDRGIVFVCDSRLVKASYGHYFLESIPNITVTYDSTYTIIEEAENWF